MSEIYHYHIDNSLCNINENQESLKCGPQKVGLAKRWHGSDNILCDKGTDKRAISAECMKH